VLVVFFQTIVVPAETVSVEGLKAKPLPLNIIVTVCEGPVAAVVAVTCELLPYPPLVGVLEGVEGEAVFVLLPHATRKMRAPSTIKQSQVSVLNVKEDMLRVDNWAFFCIVLIFLYTFVGITERLL
jgi:hypothetical protein